MSRVAARVCQGEKSVCWRKNERTNERTNDCQKRTWRSGSFGFLVAVTIDDTFRDRERETVFRVNDSGRNLRSLLYWIEIVFFRLYWKYAVDNGRCRVKFALDGNTSTCVCKRIERRVILNCVHVLESV